MAVTTAAAIRDLMRTTVKALTPTFLENARYKPFAERVDFRAWCEANTTAAFRWFSIRDLGNIAPPVVSNTDREWIETQFEVVIAYPTDHRYGRDMALDLDDCQEGDLKQVEHAIGTNGYQTLDVSTGGDACVTTVETAREQGPACVFGVLRLSVRYWRSMT